MIINDWIQSIAGLIILVSLFLGVDCSGNPCFISSYFLFLTVFVGANLFQSGFTKFCPLAVILKKLGVPETRTPES